ncbi:hypothetical protein ACIQWZ_04695 [Streptomyces sp. NPDC098077]|uniref:hypothetical protein n=1 Tax=Streptomyces sp. NPDC098077 TaxID=3366093 RepID=UPI00382FB478
MTAAEYRAAAERIVTNNRLDYGRPGPDDFRRAEIFAQLALSAAISEAAETRVAEPAQH